MYRKSSSLYSEKLPKLLYSLLYRLYLLKTHLDIKYHKKKTKPNYFLRRMRWNCYSFGTLHGSLTLQTETVVVFTNVPTDMAPIEKWSLLSLRAYLTLHKLMHKSAEEPTYFLRIYNIINKVFYASFVINRDIKSILLKLNEHSYFAN